MANNVIVLLYRFRVIAFFNIDTGRHVTGAEVIRLRSDCLQSILQPRICISQFKIINNYTIMLKSGDINEKEKE